ncbi:hypothetical protein GCM10020000_63770 [Streptomyces olivoverticillatus]
MSRTTTDTAENALLVRVLTTLLREDPYGLRRTARTEHRPDGDWLRLRAAGGTLLVPVAADGFQCEIQAREALLETADGTRLTGLRPVLDRLRGAVAAEDRPGFDAFAAECREALATAHLHDRLRPGVVERLAGTYGDTVTAWTGQRGALAFDTLAAFRDHPVHPTGRARSGLGEDELRAHAPEFHPRFPLRWLALPHTAVRGERAELPAWWPAPSALGLSGLDATHLALPVHPLTAAGPLAPALRATGLARPRPPRRAAVAGGDPHPVHPYGRGRGRPRHPPQTAPHHRHSGLAQPAHHQTRHAPRRRGLPAAAGGDHRPRAALRRHRPAGRRAHPPGRGPRTPRRPGAPPPTRPPRSPHRPRRRTARPRPPTAVSSPKPSPSATTAAASPPSSTPI